MLLVGALLLPLQARANTWFWNESDGDVWNNFNTSLWLDPRWSENDYLGGESYALAGGGTLAPIPEPGTGLLLALGLVGLAFGGRRRR
jgi:hypothetical protein